LLASAWANRGNALIRLEPPQADPARQAARQALSLCRASQSENAAAASIAFRARHVWCQSLAQLLTEPAEQGRRESLLTEATDAVDEGMALARHWEVCGDQQFRVAAAELFRFGVRVYQTYQPHFLTEFLLENLDPARSAGAFIDNVPMHATAVHALWHSLRELQRDGFKTLNTPAFGQMLASLEELRVTEGRLAQLRQAGVSA
jgi:hypothetical protein